VVLQHPNGKVKGSVTIVSDVKDKQKKRFKKKGPERITKKWKRDEKKEKVLE
jgi:hypothetical protein